MTDLLILVLVVAVVVIVVRWRRARPATRFLPGHDLYTVTCPPEVKDGPERAQRVFSALHRHITQEPLLVHQLAWRDEGDDHPQGLTVYAVPRSARKQGAAALREHFRGCIVKEVREPREFALYRPVFAEWARLEEEERLAALVSAEAGAGGGR